MIKLTKLQHDADPDYPPLEKSIYVSAQAITSIESVQLSAKHSCTQIHCGGNRYIDVKETPEQIRILMYGRDSSGGIMA